MEVTDVLAILMAVAAGVSFIVGDRALARAEDIHALYWLVVGMASLYAAVQMAKPGAKA